MADAITIATTSDTVASVVSDVATFSYDRSMMMQPKTATVASIQFMVLLHLLVMKWLATVLEESMTHIIVGTITIKIRLGT